MKQDPKRLRYSISNWSQATRCLSNNSKSLKISVSNYIHNVDFEGQIISVVHMIYGTMFATVTNGHGRIISDQDEEGRDLPLMTTAEVLVQLEKFGFDVEYNEESNLPGEQILFLMKLQDLGFDAITRIRVQYANTSRAEIIAYKSSATLDYLTFNSIVPKAHFDKSLEEGSILNIAKMDTSLEWDWLTYTCQIEDILEANSSEEPDDPIDPDDPVDPDNPDDPVDPDDPESDDSDDDPAIDLAPSMSEFHIYGDVEITDNDNEDSDSSTT